MTIVEKTRRKRTSFFRTLCHQWLARHNPKVFNNLYLQASRKYPVTQIQSNKLLTEK